MSAGAYIPGTKSWRARRDAVICMKTHAKIQQIVDGEIGAGRAEQILKRHLTACKACGAEAEVVTDLKVAIARVGSKVDRKLVTRLEQLAQELCEGRE